MSVTNEGVYPMATLPEINDEPEINEEAEVVEEIEHCPYCGVTKHLRCSFCRRKVHETVWPDNKNDFYALKHNDRYSYVVCVECWEKGERWPEPVVETSEEEEETNNGDSTQ